MQIISINNLTFKYDDKNIFDNFNLDIEKNSFVTLVGPNGAGKTTLVKIILGLYKTTSDIFIDNIKLEKNNLKQIRKKIGVAFENPDSIFVAETVIDEIAFSLENMELDKKEIKKRIDEISKYMEISNLLERDPNRLSGGEKQLVAFASAIVTEPEILIFDEAFTMVDYKSKEKIYKMLQKCNQENKTTIINITYDLEEAIYGNELIVIDKGKIITKGFKEEVFKDEKIFRELGFKLPFIVDLSIKLNYYGIIDKLYFDETFMVNDIWK